jgi:hypothetical protein
MCYAHGYGKIGNQPTQDTLRYATICEGGYQPWVQRFELRDYFYLQ